jgi:hypothetical protein
MPTPRRPNNFVQDKDERNVTAVAAVAATGTLPVGTMDGDFIVDKFEVHAPGGYASDASNYYDLSLQIKGQTFTATAATDVCNAVAHSLLTGDAVQATNAGGGLPTGLSAGVTYYVIRVDADNFKLATTPANATAGTAIDITGAGTGTQTVCKVLAMWSLKTGNNGTLTDLVFASGTLQPNPTGTSGQQLNVVLTKFGTGANVPAGTRFIAHCRQL